MRLGPKRWADWLGMAAASAPHSFTQPAGHRVPGVRFCLACCGEGGSLHHVHQPAALSVVVAEVFGPPGKLDFSREVVLKEEQRDGRESESRSLRRRKSGTLLRTKGSSDD